MPGNTHTQVAAETLESPGSGAIDLRVLSAEARRALAATDRRIEALEAQIRGMPADREIAIGVADESGGSSVQHALSRFRQAEGARRDLMARKSRALGRYGWIPGAEGFVARRLDPLIEAAEVRASRAGFEVSEARKAALMRPDCAARHQEERLRVRGAVDRLNWTLEANLHLANGLTAFIQLAAILLSRGTCVLSFHRIEARIENEVERLVERLTFEIDLQAYRARNDSVAEAGLAGPARRPSQGAQDAAGRPEHLRDELFDTRELNAVPALDGNYSVPAGKVYLPVAPSREIEVLAAGARKGPKGGYFVPLEEVGRPEIQPYLPFIARRTIEPIRMDMIPQSSFGASLANMLTDSDWERIRQPTIDEAGGLCRICGEKGRRQSRKVDCHEIWSYLGPDEPDHWGVQRLEGLIAVCEPCHLMFHLGFANATDRYGIAIERIRAVNRWTQPEAERYGHLLGQSWIERSKRPWALDLSSLAGAGPLRISSGWDLSDDGVLTRQTQHGTAVTVLLGVDWCFARGNRAVRPAQDPKPYY